MLSELDLTSDPLRFSGGEGEIRTHGTLAGSTVFETAAFDHSATSPRTLVTSKIAGSPT